MRIIALIVALLVLPSVAAQFITIPQAQIAPEQIAQIEQTIPQEAMIETVVSRVPVVTAACMEKDTRCNKDRSGRVFFQRCENGVWHTTRWCQKNEQCTAKGCITPMTLAPGIAPTPTPEIKKTLQTPIKPITPIKFYKTKLTCPTVPKTAVRLPKSPIGKNDCDLIGKSAEIEAYLAALEKIAASCNANRAAAWKAVNAARADLDKQVDALEVPPPAEDGDITIAIASCPSYGSSEPSEPSEPYPPENMYYTNWLQTITENTAKYCKLIDELIKPMWLACDEINFYRTCEELSDANRVAYHSTLKWKMNAANINYEYTAFFYTNTLQTYGWGNFRKYFNENAIDCPAKVMRKVALPGMDVRTPGAVKPVTPKEMVGLNPQPEPPMPTPEMKLKPPPTKKPWWKRLFGR